MAVNSVSNQKTIQQIIDSSAANTNNRKIGGELGKDDFLNLLVTQLRYQDPLKPTDDKEFIGQMAQFSSLEQMQNMNTSFSSVKAFSLIGKSITASIKDDTAKEAKTIQGDVTSVKMEGGKTYVVVKGEDIPIEQVTDVADGIRTSQSNLSSYTNLIGFNVNGCAYDSQTSNIVGVSGVVKSLEKGVYEDYAVMDNVKVEVSDIVTDIHSTDPNFKKNYLESHMSTNNNEISVYIVDRKTNQKVPITANLKEYNIAPDGTTTATLNNMRVPVESIVSIMPGQQA